MQNLERLQRQIKSAEALHGIVKTMKVLAAASIRQYEEAVQALRGYDHTVELALSIVLKHRPGRVTLAPPKAGEAAGCIYFGTGQGLCGRFNEQLAAFVADRRLPTDVGAPRVLVQGERLAGLLESQGMCIDRQADMPGSVAGISRQVQDVLMVIDEWRSTYGVGQIILFHNKPVSGTAYTPAMQHLLPPDPVWLRHLEERPWPTRMLPTYRMDRTTLFSALIRQYFFVTLYRTFAESLAAENASRLAAMQAAEQNIAGRLDRLHTRFRRERQAAVTEELMDIQGGYEALATKQEKG